MTGVQTCALPIYKYRKDGPKTAHNPGDRSRIFENIVKKSLFLAFFALFSIGGYGRGPPPMFPNITFIANWCGPDGLRPPKWATGAWSPCSPFGVPQLLLTRWGRYGCNIGKNEHFCHFPLILSISSVFSDFRCILVYVMLSPGGSSSMPRDTPPTSTPLNLAQKD